MRQVRITCLGSGSALSRERLWSSLLIDNTILLGLPPTAVPQLHLCGERLEAIGHIFISHLHGDHFFGWPFFLLAYCYQYQRKEPIYIIGPRGIQEAMEQLFDLAWPDLRQRKITPRVPLSFVEVEPSTELRAGALTFRAVQMEHFGMETYGYRFSCCGKEIAFTGDTGNCSQLDQLVEGVDVLITELTHTSYEENSGHMNIHDVSSLAEKVTGDGGKVIATHLGDDRVIIDGVKFCSDGETFLV